MLKPTVLPTMMTVAIIGLLTLLGVAMQASAQGRIGSALEHIIDVQEKHTEFLLTREGVVGTAVGHNREGQLAVKVFVKTGAHAAGIPRYLDGVPVAVDVTGDIVALARSSVVRTARFDRPVPIGVSTGHPDITAGTISCRVKDGAGNVYALSNNHVYANENHACAEVDPVRPSCAPVDNVLQPGPYDGGVNPADAIGTLFDYEPIVFCKPNCSLNTIDAAIALSSPTLLGNATPSDGYGTPRSTTVTPQINLRVKKYGRTTGLTKGKVYAVNVGYDTGVARFVGQIVITPGSFSAPGDSGSLIVVDGGVNDRKAVGLLFAGSSSVTIANPIGSVLSVLEVSIDGPP